MGELPARATKRNESETGFNIDVHINQKKGGFVTGEHVYRSTAGSFDNKMPTLPTINAQPITPLEVKFNPMNLNKKGSNLKSRHFNNKTSIH
jgi:hypothetical protein